MWLIVMLMAALCLRKFEWNANYFFAAASIGMRRRQ